MIESKPSRSKSQWIGGAIALSVAFGAGWYVGSRGRASRNVSPADSKPVDTAANLRSADTIRPSSIKEVLRLASEALETMSTTCDDYTARFVKQELDSKGSLSEFSEIQLKIQTRLRNETDDAPKRVYLRFTKPLNVDGREVIWAEDMHEGKMVVHEAGLLGLMTLRLDPNGLLAMQGQRYPISEIGITRLVEKLIERGEVDRDNPEVDVTIESGHVFDDVDADLIRIRRSRPGQSEDDFSLAEIVFDPTRMLILSYRSFGWAENPDESPPLQESYAYHDLSVNVGLTQADFDPTNPEYNFP